MVRVLGGLCLAAALCGLPVSAGDKADPPDRLEGRWELKDATDSDGVLKKGKVQTYVLVIEGGKMWHEYDDGTKDDARPYEADAGKDPKRFDFKTEGKRGDVQRYGIYALKGDGLKVCFSTLVPAEEARRPSDFTTKPGSGRVLLEFKRVKK